VLLQSALKVYRNFSVKHIVTIYIISCSVAANGVVLATEKKHRSILYEEHSVHKIEMITPKIGMVYSGMGPDYRLLVRQARKMAQQYWVTYQEQIPTAQLVQRVATLMQEYTQSG
jgi:20S proteasome subunit alpha 2